MTVTTVPLSEPITLSCRIISGSIHVHAEEGRTDAQVSLSSPDPAGEVVDQTTVGLHGTQLQIKAPKTRGGLFDLPRLAARENTRDRLDVRVDVPAGTDLRLVLFQGDVLVTGRAGSVDIGSGLGAVSVEQVDGDLRVRNGSGPATVGTVSGSSSLKSGTGDVTVTEARGALDAAHGSGDLVVRRARGAVRFKTGAGSVRVEAAGGDVDLTTGAGELRIGLPAGQVARLDVMTAGTLHTELPVEDDQPESLGTPITVRARSGSGDVYVYRAN